MKKSFDVNPKNLSAEKDSLWSTKGEILWTIKVYLPFSDMGSFCSPQTDFLASCTMPVCLHCLIQPLQKSPCFIFWLMKWDLPIPIRTIQIESLFATIPTNQNCTIWIPHLYKMENFDLKAFDFTEHNLGYYLNQCLLGCNSFCSNECFLFFITI